jgi:hypothetical protein
MSSLPATHTADGFIFDLDGTVTWRAGSGGGGVCRRPAPARQRILFISNKPWAGTGLRETHPFGQPR